MSAGRIIIPEIKSDAVYGLSEQFKEKVQHHQIKCTTTRIIMLWQKISETGVTKYHPLPGVFRMFLQRTLFVTGLSMNQ